MADGWIRGAAGRATRLDSPPFRTLTAARPVWRLVAAGWSSASNERGRQVGWEQHASSGQVTTSFHLGDLAVLAMLLAHAGGLVALAHRAARPDRRKVRGVVARPAEVMRPKHAQQRASGCCAPLVAVKSRARSS
jgi:hypothetical protein